MATADVAMSTLLNVSFHQAVTSENGTADNNSSFEFAHINNQLAIVQEILKELFDRSESL